MKVPTLTGTNFEEFNLDFTVTIRRQNALIGILLDYLPRIYAVVNYNAAWNSHEESIIFCVCLQGKALNDDTETLYNILVQYVGTYGTGRSTLSGHTRLKNGCKYYFELKLHFKNESYNETKASESNDIIKSEHHDGNRKVTLEHY